MTFCASVEIFFVPLKVSLNLIMLIMKIICHYLLGRGVWEGVVAIFLDFWWISGKISSRFWKGISNWNDGCPSPAPPKSGRSSWMTPSDRQLKISIKICNTKFQRQSSDPKYRIKINFPFVSSTYSRSNFNFKKFLHKNRILLVTDQKCIQF